MTPAEEHRSIAGTFTDRVVGADPEAWENQSPVKEWLARDVVRHLVEWFPPFLESGSGITLSAAPSVDDDPVAAWTAHADAVQAVLDDPATASLAFTHRHIPEMPLDQAPPSTRPTSSCTPGTSRVPQAKTNGSTRRAAHRCTTACCRWTKRSGRVVSTDRVSMSLRTPTPRPGCLLSSGVTR